MSAGRDDPVSPVSHPVNVSVLPSGGRAETVEADAARRAALADAHDLVSVARFVAVIDVGRWRRDGVRVAGTVRAQVTQRCVVTLKPLRAEVEAPFEALFVPEGPALLGCDEPGAGTEIDIDAEGPDTPEPFVPPMLDVGAVAEQFFALALDPYPRMPDVAVPADLAPGHDESGDNPFAALAALKAGSDR